MTLNSRNPKIRALYDKLYLAFTDHPKSSNETYLQHFCFTMKMSGRFAFTSLAIALHGFFPFLCTKTASHQMEKVSRIMQARNQKIQQDLNQNAAAQKQEKRVAIIGGGFSGALVLANLIRQANAPFNIDWFEPNVMGEGLAYSTKQPWHLLNVQIRKMGAFADNHEHFYEWLQSDAALEILAQLYPDKPINGDIYAPRAVYAAYIKHILRDVMTEAENKQININLHYTSVNNVELLDYNSGKLRLYFEQNNEIVADAVVLATGNLLPKSFVTDEKLYSGKYINNVWSNEASNFFATKLQQMNEDSEILIVGTGLTMVDTALSLVNNGYQGKIVAISRCGLLPLPHLHGGAAYPAWEWVVNPTSAPRTLLGLLQGLRREIRQAGLNGYSVQSVIDSLRPVTQTLWQQLDNAQRQKFLKRLATFWNVHRHRMAPEIFEVMEQLRSDDKLRVVKGKIKQISIENGRVEVDYFSGEILDIESLHPDLVLNCTGPCYNISATENKLLKNMHNNGLIVADGLRSGIALSAKNTAKGKAEDSLFPIGSLLVGELLECTAVPELRGQANMVAQSIASKII
jgi:uncharacterized NAD(P)/FAD-binding protein YdhS